MIFRKEQTFLFYNTISGQHFKLHQRPFLIGIIKKLQDIDNGYCIELSESELHLQEMKEFIQLLRENFCGDVIDREFTKIKPFSLYPVSSVMKNRERMKSNDDLLAGEKIMDYLHLLSIQITGNCDLKCDLCSTTYLQTVSCSSSDNELEYESIESIFNQISGCSLTSMNIVGGNVFSYKTWEKLMILFNRNPYRYYFFTDYRHINKDKLQDIKSIDSTLQVIIPGMFDRKILEQMFNIISGKDFELIFHISSEEQMLSTNSFCEMLQIENYTLLPVYSNSSPIFFRDFIFMDEESIVSSPVSKQTIFANMTLNTTDFGKLTVLSNGDIQANPNFPKLGNVKTDTIRATILKELAQGKSWFRIRNQKPCSDCIYQWLCPPPSNYEIAIGRSNLCHLNECINK